MNHGCCSFLCLCSDDSHNVLLPLNVFEDVALVVSCGDLEGQRCMVALEHSCVVVEDGQLASCVAQEAVGAARVVHVVHGSGNQGSYLVDGIQTLLLGKRTSETRGI